MTNPFFPAVSLLPGVPNVLRNASNALNSLAYPAAQLTADAVQIQNAFAGPQWGIFDASGSPVLTGDGVLGFDYRRDYEVSTAPQEQGAFQSYNKVQEPFDARLRFAYAGNQSFLAAIASGGFIGSAIAGSSPASENRASWLAFLETLVASLDLYQVSTPEIPYMSANPVHYDYSRTTDNGGQSMIIVDVWLREIRITATQAFSSTAAPSGANLFNNGAVQPSALTAQQQSNIQVGGVY